MDWTQSLFPKYQSKGILIDTNIFLLFLVGIVNRDRISRFNRTKQFVPEDLDLLLKIISYFGNRWVTTPNILTEVNSLTNQLSDPDRENCFSKLSEIIKTENILTENYIESRIAVTQDKFVKFGLTDSGIAQLALDRYLVLTDDFKLANYLQTINIDVLNFNHIRTAGWS